MSNFRLFDPDCVLIHIPKVAGTAIRKGAWAGHYDRKPSFGHVPPEWDHLFKFAFVRHPLDRLVSAWKMFTEGARGDPDWKFPQDAYPLTIEQFFEIVCDEQIIFDERRSTFEEKIRHHTIPQTHPFNCLHLADFVGRYENLEADFKIVCKRLNVSKELPKIHYTTHRSWIDELPPSLVEKCIRYYEQDFQVLGYRV